MPHGISDELATYVLRIAKALVPAVRSHNEARYKSPVDLDDDQPPVRRMVAATGRDPEWQP